MVNSRDGDLALVPLSDRALDDLFELWRDENVIRYTNWSTITRPEEALARIERLKQRYASAPERVGPYMCECASRFIGLIGIDYVKGARDVWYLVSRAHWGQGLGTAMVRRLIAQMCVTAPGVRLTATAAAPNLASCRILEKVGFTRREIVPNGFCANGVRADLLHYALNLQGS